MQFILQFIYDLMGNFYIAEWPTSPFVICQTNIVINQEPCVGRIERSLFSNFLFQLIFKSFDWGQQMCSWDPVNWLRSFLKRPFVFLISSAIRF